MTNNNKDASKEDKRTPTTFFNPVKTNMKKKENQHENFKAIIQFDNTPTELRIETDKTELNVKDLTRNPNKYSFGKLIWI